MTEQSLLSNQPKGGPKGCGPVEATMRQQAVAARRRLFGGVERPKRLEVVRHIVAPVLEPLPPPTPDPVDLPYATPTIRGIIDATCSKHGITRKELLSMSRRRDIIKCRQECCYELRNTILIQGRQISLPEIAHHLGGLDHTTVLYSIRKHEACLSTISTLSTETGTNAA